MRCHPFHLAVFLALFPLVKGEVSWKHHSKAVPSAGASHAAGECKHWAIPQEHDTQSASSGVRPSAIPSTGTAAKAPAEHRSFSARLSRAGTGWGAPSQSKGVARAPTRTHWSEASSLPARAEQQGLVAPVPALFSAFSSTEYTTAWLQREPAWSNAVACYQLQTAHTEHQQAGYLLLLHTAKM